MPRTVKAPEERSAELLDCAQRQFFARGYERTTVNDILRDAGLSKGAFYHYFESKEALLEALALRLARQSMAELEPALDDPALDPVGKLNAVFAGSRRMKIEMAPQLRATFDVLFRPENAALFHRVNQALTEVAVPVFARIIREGAEAGVFDAGDPEAVAEMLLHLRLGFGATMSRYIARADAGHLEAAARELDERLRLYGLAIDRVLRLPDGTVQVAEPGFARALLAPAD